MQSKIRLSTQAIEFADLLQRDGSVALTGALDAGSNKITNLADATASGDAVNKGQLDSAISALANGVVYKGLFDASGGSFPSDPSQGDFYKVSVAGTVDGLELAIGDMIIANADVTGASAATNWDKIDNTEISHASMEADITTLQTNKLDIADIIENEKLTVTDGSPTPSELAYTPVSGSVKVYVNGMRQTPTDDFTVSGKQITFTYNLKTNPGQSDVVLVDYRTA